MGLTTLPIWANVLVFVAAAAVVWMAGTRLSHLADAIARRTGIGQAALGVLLLGGITSLPEIAVTGTAALRGAASLAANNLLGGFTMQVAVLAVADLTFRRRALTAAVPDPIVLLQGGLGILLMAMVVAGIGTGDVAFLGAGLWTWGILAVFIYAIWLVAAAEGRTRAWEAVGNLPSATPHAEDETQEGADRRLIAATAGAGAMILVGGAALAASGEALAEQSGLGESFFGAVFVAFSTSLPEVSTVTAAIRLRRYVMAVSDIFGTNLFDVALIFLVDMLHSGGPILNEIGSFSSVAAALGIVVTAIYLIGLIERRDPAVVGIGLDSLAVAVAYLGGIALLYGLR
jgi:cation:H+ antiporter